MKKNSETPLKKEKKSKRNSEITSYLHTKK